MTRIIEIGTTRIGILEIAGCCGCGRREAERIATRRILCDMLGHDAQPGHTPAGAPTLPGFHISISHSRLLAAVALDPVRPVGIDVEEYRPTHENVRSRFTTDEELALISSPPPQLPNSPTSPLLLAWTSKEAIYKTLPEVGPDFIRDITLLSPASARATGRRFTLTHIPLPPPPLPPPRPQTQNIKIKTQAYQPTPPLQGYVKKAVFCGKIGRHGSCGPEP